MLVQSLPISVAPTSQYVPSAGPNGVDEEDLRNDIPPVNAAPAKAGSQNQLFQGSGSAAELETTQSSTQPDNQQGSRAEDTTSRPEQGVSAESRRQQQQAEEDLVVIQQLKSREREVRLHEAAHASVGGRYAGAPSFEYTTGPDGKRYVTGGEVSISTSEAGDPQATIEKARVIQAAALAPAQPSAQDRRVAAEAAQMELQAQQELRELESEERAQEAQQREDVAEEEGDESGVALVTEEDSSIAEQASAPTSPQPVTQPSFSPPGATDREQASSNDEGRQTEREPGALLPTELEEILLGSTNLLQRANQQGFIDPQNPYGKSGLLDILV